MSSMQSCIGHSSAESEPYVSTREAADWQTQAAIFLYCDPPAARAAMQRQGVGGKLRHVQTRHWWLQGRAATGHLALRCVDGLSNPADVLTKAHWKASATIVRIHVTRWLVESSWAFKGTTWSDNYDRSLTKADWGSAAPSVARNLGLKPDPAEERDLIHTHRSLWFISGVERTPHPNAAEIRW